MFKQMIGCVVVAGLVLAMGGAAQAALITTGLSVHYRADNVDGAGTPGDGSTTTLVNLANPGTYNGTIVGGSVSGVVQNVAQIGTPYEYGIVLDGATDTANPTHIQANTYQIAGGVAKVTAATWEFWLKADNGGLPTSVERGALYGEFPAGTLNRTRHYLRLEGIGTGTRSALYDEYTGYGGGSGSSGSPLFETSTFTQIVVTKDGNTMTFYKNGVQAFQDTSADETFNGTPSPDRTYFGMREHSNGNNESFDGQFNIIRVYDTALTPAEIEGNFDSETIGGGGDAIPEPATMCALGMAVAGLGGYVRRRRMA